MMEKYTSTTGKIHYTDKNGYVLCFAGGWVTNENWPATEDAVSCRHCIRLYAKGKRTVWATG